MLSKTNIFILVFFLLLLLAYTLGFSQASSLRMNFSSQEVKMGESLTVEIVISKISDLKGVDLRISFDKQRLKCNSINKGNAIHSFAEYINFFDNDAGKLEYMAVLNAQGRGLDISEGVLCSLSFATLSAGKATLTFEETSPILANSQAMEIGAQFVSGSVVVQSVGKGISGKVTTFQSTTPPPGMTVTLPVMSVPIADATIQAWQGDKIVRTVQSETDGTYTLDVPEGSYTVRAYKTGYIPGKLFNQKSPAVNVDFILNKIPVVKPTPNHSDFWSENTRLDDQPINIGDAITARDPDGVICGVHTVEYTGVYGVLHVYGDDLFTPETDEGAKEGDTITFYINEQEAVVVSGSTKWTPLGSQRLDLSAKSPSKTAEPWDVNGDNVVDISDLILVGKHFGESTSTVGDVNGDGAVDILDLVIIISHFGE